MDSYNGIGEQESQPATMYYNSYQRALNSMQNKLSSVYRENYRMIKLTIGAILIVLYFGYFGYAIYYRYGYNIDRAASFA